MVPMEDDEASLRVKLSPGNLRSLPPSLDSLDQEILH